MLQFVSRVAETLRMLPNSRELGPEAPCTLSNAPDTSHSISSASGAPFVFGRWSDEGRRGRPRVFKSDAHLWCNKEWTFVDVTCRSIGVSFMAPGKLGEDGVLLVLLKNIQVVARLAPSALHASDFPGRPTEHLVEIDCGSIRQFLALPTEVAAKTFVKTIHAYQHVEKHFDLYELKAHDRFNVMVYTPSRDIGFLGYLPCSVEITDALVITTSVTMAFPLDTVRKFDSISKGTPRCDGHPWMVQIAVEDSDPQEFVFAMSSEVAYLSFMRLLDRSETSGADIGLRKTITDSHTLTAPSPLGLLCHVYLSKFRAFAKVKLHVDKMGIMVHPIVDKVTAKECKEQKHMIERFDENMYVIASASVNFPLTSLLDVFPGPAVADVEPFSADSTIPMNLYRARVDKFNDTSPDGDEFSFGQPSPVTPFKRFWGDMAKINAGNGVSAPTPFTLGVQCKRGGLVGIINGELPASRAGQSSRYLAAILCMASEEDRIRVSDTILAFRKYGILVALSMDQHLKTGHKLDDCFVRVSREQTMLTNENVRPIPSSANLPKMVVSNDGEIFWYRPKARPHSRCARPGAKKIASDNHRRSASK